MHFDGIDRSEDKSFDWLKMPIGSVLGHGIYAAMVEGLVVWISHEWAMNELIHGFKLKFKLKSNSFLSR